MSLIEIMRELIAADPQSSITFQQFMELALYHPTYGYYRKSRIKVGKQGDFYTNSSVGSVYGEVLGDVFAQMLDIIPGDQPLALIEVGGGNGDFMHQVVSAWKNTYPQLMDSVNLVMVEQSPYHRRIQKEKLNGMSVQWAESLDDYYNRYGKVNGVIFSNELIDALPVYVVEFRSGEWQEVRVTWDGVAGKFVEVLKPLMNEKVISSVMREESVIPLQDGYRMEVNLEGVNWLHNVASITNNGYVVTVDYGFLRDDLYITERRNGSIIGYKNHRTIDNPLIEPGEMDITSHVNFSVLLEEGEKYGLTPLGFFTQSEFLINAGILEKLMNHQETDPFSGTVSKRNRAIRQLIMPEALGQTFKVLIQTKGTCPHELDCLKKRSWI